MYTYSKYSRLPLGAVRPKGFLLEQMERNRDGMGGHLYEIEPEMILYPYIDKRPVGAWSAEDLAGWGGEISGNYWTAYIQMAFVLNDKAMIEKATWWVDTMMKKQKPDGYLGTYYEEDANIYEDFNGWGTACAMRGLLAFSEATGREDVFNAVYRCMLWFCEKWSGNKKTAYAGGFVVEPMAFCYHRTGDERLLKFCEEYEDFLCREDKPYRNSWKTMLYGDLLYNSNHTAGVATAIRRPIMSYTVTGKKEYLDAAERMIEMIQAKCVNLNGGPVCVTEYLGPVGATTETEYCAFSYYNQTYAALTYITGNPKYGEYMEEMFYNGAQGARKKDEKCIAYMSAPNQIYATEISSPGAGGGKADMQAYAPCYPVACCPVNSISLLPEFVRDMFFCNGKDIYASVYGPCEVCYNGITITEDTMYPFRNTITFRFEGNDEFGMHFRIPSWAEDVIVKLNGEESAYQIDENGFAVIYRAWKTNDTLEIYFKTSVRVIHVNDDDLAGKHPLAIKYGALLYAYHIQEDWVAIKGTPLTELPEGWSWYDVLPHYDPPKLAHDRDETGLRGYFTPWTFAVDENLVPGDVSIEELEPVGYPWENPPIRLHTYCYQAPYLTAKYPRSTYEPYLEYQLVVREKKELILEPYGCTNLRISYMYKADLTKDIN